MANEGLNWDPLPKNLIILVLTGILGGRKTQCRMNILTNKPKNYPPNKMFEKKLSFHKTLLVLMISLNLDVFFAAEEILDFFGENFHPTCAKLLPSYLPKTSFPRPPTEKNQKKGGVFIH